MDWDAVSNLFYSMHCTNDGADLKSSILILPGSCQDLCHFGKIREPRTTKLLKKGTEQPVPVLHLGSL